MPVRSNAVNTVLESKQILQEHKIKYVLIRYNQRASLLRLRVKNFEHAENRLLIAVKGFKCRFNENRGESETRIIYYSYSFTYQMRFLASHVAVSTTHDDINGLTVRQLN